MPSPFLGTKQYVALSSALYGLEGIITVEDSFSGDLAGLEYKRITDVLPNENTDSHTHSSWPV